MSWLYARVVLGIAFGGLLAFAMFLAHTSLSAQAERLPPATSPSTLQSIQGLPGYILNSQINPIQQAAKKANYTQGHSLYSIMEPPDEQGLVTFTDRYHHSITQEEFMQNIQPPPLQDASY